MELTLENGDTFKAILTVAKTINRNLDVCDKCFLLKY